MPLNVAYFGTCDCCTEIGEELHSVEYFLNLRLLKCLGKQHEKNLDPWPVTSNLNL